MENKAQTIREWLEQLAAGSTSTERDDSRMNSLLHRVNFRQAVCTCGIVYLEGQGTPEYPPQPIQTVARMLIDIGNR